MIAYFILLHNNIAMRVRVDGQPVDFVIVEEKYRIKLGTRELDNLHSVGDLVRAIVGRTGSSPG
jgi:hypothetical protein